MIRILHIIPGLRKGGAERLALDICAELSKRTDVEVRMVCLSELNEYPEYSDKVRPVVIKSATKLSIFRKNKLLVGELQEFVNDFKPDIIHSHLFEAEIVSRSIYYPNAKWYSHCHDNMVQFRNLGVKTLLSKQALTNFYEKRFLFQRYATNGGNHFIAISRDTQAYFSKTAKPYFVTLLHNAIDNKKFSNPDLKQMPGNVLRLINIGSFVEKKNQTFLLDVGLALKKQSIPFELHLVGDGDKRTVLESRAKTLRIEKDIIFHGSVDNVEKLLWQSDIYVHSATYEPLGLVLLEAMAAGLPVITIDGKGNRDLIAQGKNGIMLMERDAEKFAGKILEVWENKNLYSEMAAFAQKFAKGYDIKEYVDRLLVIYKQTP